MKSLIIALLLPVLTSTAYARDWQQDRNIEVNTALSTLFYQSVYSFQSSSALTAAIRGNISEQWDWQTGIRLGFSPALFDGFIRVLAVPRLGHWRPSAGFELGATNRAQFDEGEKLLRETRTAMEGQISNIYIGVHAAPFSFIMGQVWRLSIAELNIGTNLGNTGRTLRVQFGFLSVGRSL